MRRPKNPNQGRFIIMGRYGHNAHHSDIREMLGLVPKPPRYATPKLPEGGMATREIQGIKVWVTPLVRTGPLAGQGRRAWKSSTHRVLAQCPSCLQVLSVGRLHQHVCRQKGPLKHVGPFKVRFHDTTS